jgi:2-oxoisovalerate dehydrogenase E1 component
VLDLAGEGLVHGPAHSASARRAAPLAPSSPDHVSDQINGSHRGHHQFLSKALGHIAPQGARPEGAAFARECKTCCSARWPRSWGWIAGLLPWPRAARCTCSWVEAGALGTNAIVGGGVPLAAGAAWAHKHAGTDAVACDLFWRWGGQHRLGAGDHEPGRRLEAAALLLHREQPLRRLHPYGGVHGRDAPVGARPGLRQHPELEGRWHGSAGRAPGHAGGPGAHARGQGPHGDRGRCLPLLPPERPASRAAPLATAARIEEQEWRARDPLDAARPECRNAACSPRATPSGAAPAHQGPHGPGQRRAAGGRPHGQAGQAPHQAPNSGPARTSATWAYAATCRELQGLRAEEAATFTGGRRPSSASSWTWWPT